MTEKSSLPEEPSEAPATELAGGTYEIIRGRLAAHGKTLRGRIDELNAARKEVFGSVEPALLATERITTANNCVPRDMVEVGDVFLFGYNVQLGLRSDMTLTDVFAVYGIGVGHALSEKPLDLLKSDLFEADFQELYKYYKKTRFAQFSVLGPFLYMVFYIGEGESDTKVFKWHLADGGGLTYVDSRSEHECVRPPQQEFEWVRTHRDMHRSGLNPHISVLDKIFVETVGGDLTIKIEDNTDSGEGVYAEPVDDADQTLDDAEIFYAEVGELILLKMKPYQETDPRYIVYSCKVQQACRIDAIATACVLLPEDHGIIFSNGYYLQTGEYKEFDSDLRGLNFERRIVAANGEDYLFVFYDPSSGVYVLLSYNLIERKVETPVVCNGYSLFEDGTLIYVRAEEDPSRSHVLQVWRTPYCQEITDAPRDKDSFLFKIGNRDIVRAMAGCNGILGLLGQEDRYANLYVDISTFCTDLTDSYFWIADEAAFNLGEPIAEIKGAAEAAIDEFEKVVSLRKRAAEQLKDVSKRAHEVLHVATTTRFESIEEFVESLAALRGLRGEVISLREVRYVDLVRCDEMDVSVKEANEKLSQACVEFLLAPQSLDPYRVRVEEQKAAIDGLTKVMVGRELEDAVKGCSDDLELLVDIVSNLKIDDATQRTTIIDNISGIFTTLNQVRAALSNKIQDMGSAEGEAEFASQMKLVNQAVINYLDVCDTPDKCEEYLTKMMIQIEELEALFSDFDEFVVLLADKRDEVYNAFGGRKVKLVEARNRKADGLFRSAERILKGIRTRAAGFETVDEIHGYFAADLMIDKVRDVVAALEELGDTVKSGDIQAQLKTIREDTVRQLKDKLELFVDGENVIRFGKNHFSVNTQALDLTAVQRDDDMFLHLTGTDFFERVSDEAFLATRDLWSQDVVSENTTVYRAEYLAYCIFDLLESDALGVSRLEFAALSYDDVVGHVQQYMAPRYTEGYIKGVHDHDAALIVQQLVTIHGGISLLRYGAKARALANLYWALLEDDADKALLEARLRGFGVMAEYFPGQGEQDDYVALLRERLREFVDSSGLFDPVDTTAAGEYLFYARAQQGARVISPEAAAILAGFTATLKKRSAAVAFAAARAAVNTRAIAHFTLVRDWVMAFLESCDGVHDIDYCDEVVVLLLGDTFRKADVASVSVGSQLDGFMGQHPQIDKGVYRLNYNEFMARLSMFADQHVPRFEAFSEMKHQLVATARDELRLSEFVPRVLTSFVRNKLLDTVYLPMIGDNLAKQIGVVGRDTRTDRMGLLLLISPPGYGKTTLMEYVANRLGLVFMKVNGPAIGHSVTSLDPAEATNAAAREELAKLNLALEMGDNIMLYLDDIQHCNPEFLQKFISLCDAQRKIEGIYKGTTRTYDLRGKKVAVVMAGNPYTESGEMFKVPDMLANRADTYNLGDIIGDSEDVFKMSYLENSLTSNSTLNTLGSRSQSDVHAIIQIAETGTRDGVDLEGQYTSEELNDMITVMKKLIRVRDVILAVNLQYIQSAAMKDEFRKEPAFKLQGSYRNMNRLAEKVLPIMNDAELDSLILSHYQNDAQTLTSGAESNIIKFRLMTGMATAEDEDRWREITRAFKRHQVFKGTDGDDKMGQMIAQLGTFTDGLTDIRDAVAQGVVTLSEGVDDGKPDCVQTEFSPDTLTHLRSMLEQLKPPVMEPVTMPAPVVNLPDVTETTLSSETLAALGGLMQRLELTMQSSVTSSGAIRQPVAPDLKKLKSLRKRIASASAAVPALAVQMAAEYEKASKPRPAGPSSRKKAPKKRKS